MCFVTIRLTRKASRPDKKGLEKMLGYYVQCDMAACGRISAGLTRPGLVRQKDKPVINGVVRGYTYNPVSQHLLHTSHGIVNCPSRLLSSTAPQNSRVQLHPVRSPAVRVQSLA